MLFEDLQDLCDRIILGKSIIEDQGHIYVISDPSPYYRQLSNLQYTKDLEQLRIYGVPTKDEIDIILRERYIWNDEKDELYQRLLERKKEIGRQLKEVEFQSLKKDKLRLELEHTELRIKKLSTARNSLYNQCAESLAINSRYKYLLFYLTKDVYGNSFWSNISEFLKLNDMFLVNLMNRSFFDERLNEKNIRLLARSDPWRTVWLGACKTGRLFTHPMCEVTDYQRLLVSWSILYDNVYESMDRPSEEIINDDDLLDQWLLTQKEERNKENNRDKFNSKQRGVVGGTSLQEIAIPVDTVEDAKKVFELNSQIGKKSLKSRSKALWEAKTLHEGQMPDTKTNIQMIKNQIAIEQAKKRSR